MANITMSLSGGITLSTDMNTATIPMVVDEQTYKSLNHELSISKFSFHKKMYQPTEVIADISIVPSTDESSDYQEISRKVLDKKFKHAQVSLKEGDFSIGDDFYVHEVLPHYGKDSMSVTLKIYSLDKLLTMREACRTFVGKKLGADILASEIPKYIKPWTNDLETKETLTYGTDNMHILNYEAGKEHIFPYLVQYNESFYDLLARTANRWGEFLYYEGGKLNIGYNSNSKPIVVNKDEIQDITYGNLNTNLLKLATDGVYDYLADNSSLAGKPIQKSPYYVRGQMGEFGGTPDKWVMKQFPGIFMNEKNLPTMMANLLFDNIYYLAMKEGRTAKRNADVNKKFFKNYDVTSEQCADDYTFQRDYDEKKTVKAPAFQQFTELDTIFTGEKYEAIVEKELTSGRKAIYINYGTTHPEVLLGSIITFNDENFIVVEVTGGFNGDRHLVFQVVATAQDDDDKLFYPAVIPAGHVRFVHPQMATITDAKDPTRRNRARVMFSWETIKYENGEITEDTKDLSSPWLTFASGQQGHPMAGKHYEGDHVMVGFQEGNVERPYVIGALAEEDCRHLNIDSILTSQGMHKLILSDGTGAGMEAFLGGAISPLSKTFMNFAPGLIPFMKWEKSKYFEGGFELSDYYGTYRITGSTDGRNVTIASNWGDVKINAFTGIDISAPNGDVNISGKDVTIEAGNNLTLESGTNIDYKLWKSKETTNSQLLTDVGNQVAKRLAEIGHPLDLSIVRSAVEIFFRPVEGSLTVKSNRFLKLESGNSSCRLPTKAYNVEIQTQVLAQVNKSIELGQGMLNALQVLKIVSYIYMNKFKTLYFNCASALSEWCGTVAKFEFLRNGWLEMIQERRGDIFDICEMSDYDDFKDQLWSQEKDEDWSEDKIGFYDIVAIEGDLKKIVDPYCIMANYGDLGYTLPFYDDEDYKEIKRDEKRREIIEKRKEMRKKFMKDFQNLRKLVYKISHFDPTIIEENIEVEFSRITNREIPVDYKMKILNALSIEKCPCAVMYLLPMDIRELSHKDSYGRWDQDATYLARMGAIGLLEEFGLKDDMRNTMRFIDGYRVPPKPLIPEDFNDVIMWDNYVRSLNFLPLLNKDVPDAGESLKKAEPGFWKGQLDKLDFLKGAREIKVWGEGKDGQILFGSGKNTYALNDSKFEKVTSSLNSNDAFATEEIARKVTDEIQNLLMDI